ncbi:MAG: ribonuclease HI family protein [Coriobacteriales bacterium]|jgi:ribonuclease HI|nr:ribonuclease HI family protein [Coriobacteriales bacterium]
MAESYILNTDGASRGNPGPCGVGFVLYNNDGANLNAKMSGGACIGVTTNGQAEYQGLIWGLQNALAFGVQNIEVRADSEFMVKQLNGEYRVKNIGIKPLYEQASMILQEFKSTKIVHVMREENALADALCNEALDKNADVGDFLVPYSSGDLFGGIF